MDSQGYYDQVWSVKQVQESHFGQPKVKNSCHANMMTASFLVFFVIELNKLCDLFRKKEWNTGTMLSTFKTI